MRIISIKNVVLILCCLTSVVSFADGNKLLKSCKAAELFVDTEFVGGNLAEIAYCAGMLQGVRNTMKYMSKFTKGKMCFPEEGIENEQAVRIVVAYLNKNPADLHMEEAMLTMLAYYEVYACK